MAKYVAHHPAPPNKPRENWVDKVGGLPKPIDAIMRALMAKGWAQSRAVATAVNAVKKGCATGTAFGGKAKLSAEARATACRAVAEWEAKKARAKAMATDPDQRRAIELAFKRIEGDALRIDMARTWSPALHPRDKMGRWRAVVGQTQDLDVGDKVKVGKSFEIEKVKDKGVRKYVVTMKTGALTGGRVPDQVVYADTAAEAADAALGISLAEAESQVKNIRAGKSESERKRKRRDLSMTVVLPNVIDMAGGLVPATIQVKHPKTGRVFSRKIMVRPSQAKAMKAQKGGAKVSQRGLKVTKEQTAVLNELAKIPKEQRPKGWQDAVRTLADPRHGGRLGPEKRRTLHALAQASPEGSPLRAAIAKALQADAAKPSERKKGKRVMTRKPRKIVPVGKGARTS